ncbi:MAG: MoaD/ThiS family protein [Clostridia bacterium]|nr:MoaD/ThiS family protein [Clostridia bacterium]
MQVKVKVHGHAREYFPGQREDFVYEFSPDATVLDMFTALGIKPELVMSVVADGVPVPKTHVLTDGEALLLITPVAGG